MLNWTIQITLISILIVFLVHHIIHFLKETLTVPKIKDLVNVPHERYQKMYETMNSNNKDKNNNQPSNNQPSNNQPSNNQPSNNQPINNQPLNNQPINNQPLNNQTNTLAKEDMKNELKQFMKMQQMGNY
jgi:hypothetical protein